MQQLVQTGRVVAQRDIFIHVVYVVPVTAGGESQKAINPTSMTLTIKQWYFERLLWRRIPV
jgi:hypothetical protein